MKSRPHGLCSLLLAVPLLALLTLQPAQGAKYQTVEILKTKGIWVFKFTVSGGIAGLVLEGVFELTRHLTSREFVAKTSSDLKKCVEISESLKYTTRLEPSYVQSTKDLQSEIQEMLPIAEADMKKMYMEISKKNLERYSPARIANPIHPHPTELLDYTHLEIQHRLSCINKVKPQIDRLLKDALEKKIE